MSICLHFCRIQRAVLAARVLGGGCNTSKSSTFRIIDRALVFSDFQNFYVTISCGLPPISAQMHDDSPTKSTSSFSCSPSFFADPPPPPPPPPSPLQAPHLPPFYPSISYYVCVCRTLNSFTITLELRTRLTSFLLNCSTCFIPQS